MAIPPKKFILILNGPVAAGKTTVSKAILKKIPRVFELSQNAIKWLISDYNPDTDREAVQDSLLLVAERMIKEGMNLLLEGGSVTQAAMNERLEEIGLKHDMKIIYLNIEAPLEVLKERFAERVKTAEEQKKKLSFTDEEGYMERYNAYLDLKGEAPVIDSSILSPEQAVDAIMDFLPISK